jgi:hypothetical protein
MSWTVIEDPAQSVAKPLGSTTITRTPNGAEAVDGEFRRLVAGDARGASHTPADRGELHDRAAALSAQLRNDRSGHVVDAPEVGLELGAEVVLAARLDRRDVRVPGVVDDDVETAEAGHAGADRGTHGVGVGHVERERQHPVAVPSGERGEMRGLARRGDDEVAGAECRLDESAAEAPRGTCNEPYLLHDFSKTQFC